MRYGQCTVRQLKEAIKDLKDTDVLCVNDLGNLALIRGDTQIGYIDLGNEEYKNLHADLEFFDNDDL